MDALLIALVAGLLAEIGGRTQWACYALSGDRAPERRLVAILLFVLVSSLVIAAFGGAFVSASMPPAARRLMLGLALLLAGVSQLTAKNRAVDRLDWPGDVKAAFKLGAAHIADGTPFLAFAIAARAGNPGLTIFGALLAVLVICLPSIFIPEDWHRPALLARLRRIAAAILIVCGLWSALAGLGVI